MSLFLKYFGKDDVCDDQGKLTKSWKNVSAKGMHNGKWELADIFWYITYQKTSKKVYSWQAVLTVQMYLFTLEGTGSLNKYLWK